MTNKYFLIRKLHIMFSSKIKIGEVLPSATAGAALLAHAYFNQLKYDDSE